MEKTECIIEKNKIFQNYKYKNEKELENRVKNNFKLIFGEDSLFLPLKQKIESSYRIKGIPDGFLVDLKSNKLFIVEFELKKHGFFEHIFGQITRFKNAFNNKEENKRKIVEAIYNNLNSEDKSKIGSLSKKDGVFKYIHNIIFHKEFGILVIINEKTKDLEDLKEEYLPNLECVEFKTYKSSNKEIYKVNWFIKKPIISKKRVFKKYSTKDNLERANPEIKKTFKILKAKIFKLPKVKEKPGDHYFDYRIKGSKKGTFVSVSIRTDRLSMLIKMGKKRLKDPKKISSEVPKQWGYGDMTKRFSIDSREDVNYAMRLIKQAYKYTKG